MPSKDALQRLIDGLQTLIREHLALARAEIKDDLRVMGRDLLVGASGVPALAAGYLLLMVAIGYLLGVWLPLWAAFGIVAVVNLGVGGAVSLAGLRKIMRQRVGMPRTEHPTTNRQGIGEQRSSPLEFSLTTVEL